MTVLNFDQPQLLPVKRFYDERGYFQELWRESGDYPELMSAGVSFVQDNFSHSLQNVLRGLHYQLCKPQGKLLTVLHGKIFDVCVDLRRSQSMFGRVYSFELSSAQPEWLWIPPGFAHGFYVLSEQASCFYKCTEYFDSTDNHTIRWNDPTLNIPWPLIMEKPVLSAKDAAGCDFVNADYFL